MLPEGVGTYELLPHLDERGSLVEIFRADRVPLAPVQWNAVRSHANVLRGVHAHVDHHDYITVVAGRMLIGLFDLRAGPTEDLSAFVELAEDRPSALHIPPGVAHGFWFERECTFVYGVTHPWSPTDELGCRWDDPGLGLGWPCRTPSLSLRDATAGSLSDLRRDVRARLAGAGT